MMHGPLNVKKVSY